MISFLDQTSRLLIIFCLAFIGESLVFLEGGNFQQLQNSLLVLLLVVGMRIYTKPMLKARQTTYIKKPF